MLDKISEFSMFFILGGIFLILVPYIFKKQAAKKKMFMILGAVIAGIGIVSKMGIFASLLKSDKL